MEEIISTIISESTCTTSVDLKLQKILAKLILDVKYESNITQTSVDMLLSRFRSFFNEAVDLFEDHVRKLTQTRMRKTHTQ